MKKLLALTMLALALTVGAQAQTEKPEPQEKADKVETTEIKGTNVIVPQGATAKVSLQTRLSSKISEVGDEVIGVLYESVRGSDGRALGAPSAAYRSRSALLAVCTSTTSPVSGSCRVTSPMSGTLSSRGSTISAATMSC